MNPLAPPLERLIALFNRYTPYVCTPKTGGVDFVVAGEHLWFDEEAARELIESILISIGAAPSRRRQLSTY